MIDLNRLRYFYEVAHAQSFTRAAMNVGVSQPSISKMVSQLEDEHGVKLFDRDGRTVRLTAVGEALYQKCRPLFEEFSRLEETIRTRRDDCAGELAFGASENLCNYVLPSLLPDFCKRYPNIVVKLLGSISETIKNEIRNRSIEFGLFFTPVKEQHWVVSKIAEVEFLIVRAPQLTEDLTQATFIGSRAADYSGPYPALQLLHSLRLEPQGHFEVHSQETQKRLALAGLGFTVLPRFMAQEELSKGALVPVRTAKRMSWPLYCARLKSHALSKQARVFIDEFRQRSGIA